MNLRCLVWNLEWATQRAARGKLIANILTESKADADVMCLTEIEQSMYPEEGHLIESDADYGYSKTEGRRKVVLWSKEPWEDVHVIRTAGMPGGRFISGVTMGVRFLGVCIPWRDAHVSTGRKDRKAWEDHLAFLDGLNAYLNELDFREAPVCICGDFNQRIPPSWQPKHVYEKLVSVLEGRFEIITRDQVDEESKLLIDHLAVSSGITGSVESVIAKKSDDMKLSDHSGVICSIASK